MLSSVVVTIVITSKMHTAHTDPPECTNCHHLLSVKHILIERTSYNQTQQRYVHTNLEDIVTYYPTKNIFNFIKNVNLHDKL